MSNTKGDEMVARIRIDPVTYQEHALAIVVEQLRSALTEACDIAESEQSQRRCRHPSDYIGRGALTDDATCNNLMPCSAHGGDPRIAELRKLVPQ